jgi:hypothetical protein
VPSVTVVARWQYAGPMRWPGRRRAAREEDLHVGDPRFDAWDVVRDFEDLETAQAWRRQLLDAGIEAVLTADWPLDRFRRGDIALRVPPGRWSEANELLDEPD